MKIRIASGRVTLTVDLPAHPPATVGDALQRLAASHPETRTAWTDASGRPRESLQLFVNGENVRYRGGLACPLAEGDEIYVIPLIAGG
jgi:molybdopterin converting factor small subunit